MYYTGLLLAGMAAAGYTLASFFLKLSIVKGARTAQLNLWSNVAMGLVVQPLWFFDDPLLANAHPAFPLLSCLTFLAGQVLTFAALSQGDVSIATPLLGTKVVGVTVINAVVFSIPMPARWWVASAAASLGIAIIAGIVPRGQFRSAATTAALALGAAFFFSLTDTLVQSWAGGSDPLAYLPLMFGGVGLLSALWCLAFDRKAFSATPAVRRALSAGAFLLAVQAGLVFLSLCWTRDATATNIIYGSRSLFTVIAARLIGRMFGLTEAAMPPWILVLRLTGALLLFAAIFLILL
ncbi:MAG: DMT family transporter [Terrimicrobiaceae bacterium]